MYSVDNIIFNLMVNLSNNIFSKGMLAQRFFGLARHAPKRAREHTLVCDRVSDKRNAVQSKKDQAKGVWGYMVK